MRLVILSLLVFLTSCITNSHYANADAKCQRWGYLPDTGAYNQCVDQQIQQLANENSQMIRQVFQDLGNSQKRSSSPSSSSSFPRYKQMCFSDSDCLSRECVKEYYQSSGYCL